MLKSSKKVMFEVDYGDFERFVKETYGQDYNFVASEECGNDSVHDFNVNDKEALDEYDQEKLDTFKTTGRYSFLNRTILQDLVNHDLIEPGNYLISVCW